MKFRNLLRPVRAAVSDQRGYTLIELIGAMMIFALISVVIVGALVTVMQSSTKTSAERKVQQDTRYSIEEIARQTRSATVDYLFYAQNAGDARCGFSATDPNATKALALIFTSADAGNGPTTKRLIFYYDNQTDPAHPAVYRYQNSAATVTPSCASIFSAPLDAASGPSRSKITATGVDIPLLTFYVSPNQNPYDQSAPCGPSCQLARNTHPRTTILMTARTIGTGLSVSQATKTGTATLQTTVGSRAYPITTLLGQPST